MRLMHAKQCVQRSTAWAGQAREIVFDGRGVTGRRPPTPSPGTGRLEPE